MSVIRKPGAAAGARPSPTTPEQRTLVSLLEMAFGAAEPVDAILAHALVLAGREELPATGPELVAFVRAHLLTPLSDHIGPRLTMALVDDLVAQIDPASPPVVEPSVPPSSMPRPIARITPRAASSPRVRAAAVGVLLVDPDRVARASLARALLRAQWDVRLVETTSDLVSVLDTGEPIHVALVDDVHAHAEAIVEALAQARPDVAVVARSAESLRTRALLAHLGFMRFDVRSREAPADELVDAIRRLTGE